jgi:hypothetical protein
MIHCLTPHSQHTHTSLKRHNPCTTPHLMEHLATKCEMWEGLDDSQCVPNIKYTIQQLTPQEVCINILPLPLTVTTLWLYLHITSTPDCRPHYVCMYSLPLPLIVDHIMSVFTYYFYPWLRTTLCLYLLITSTPNSRPHYVYIKSLPQP